MTQFSVPWQPKPARTNLGVPGKAIAVGFVLLLVATLGWSLANSVFEGHPIAILLLVVGPVVTAFKAFALAMVVKTWRGWGEFLFRNALMILVGAVVSVCVGVFLVNLLFGWVSTDFVAQADDPSVSTYFGGALSMGEVTAALPWLPGWLAILLWPLQFPLVRDLTSLGALAGFFNIIPVYLIWWERKVAGRIQSRLGPMRVGGWHGWAQTFADGIKLVLKEDLVPKDADAPLFRIAPYFALIPSLLAFLALPLGATYVFRELDVAIVFVLSMLGVEVVGVIIAGWASNNKWSVYGAMREACQMVSYEIPMGMTLLIPIVCVGSMSLRTIAEAQSGGWFTWLAFSNPFAFLGFIGYFVASLASCKRAPFDLPEAESELVAGFHTEYSGFRWSLFFFAEYAAMFVVCALAVILFLGGWNSPLPLSWGDQITALVGNEVIARGINGVLFSGPIWLVLKAVFFLYVQIWLRWTLPRIRLDQVLYACVQVLLPLSMVLLLGNAVWVLIDTTGGEGWQLFSDVWNWILGALGIGAALTFPAVAAYGFYHRRRMVGCLAVDAMPAS